MSTAIKPGIVYSCYFTRSRDGEQFVPEHVFSYQVAGTLTVYDAGGPHVFRPGDFRFVRRNQLSKFVKQPPENGEFRSVSIYLDQGLLREVATDLNLKSEQKHAEGPAVMALDANPLYMSFMESLLVYLQLPQENNLDLIRLKTKEAVQLLLKVNPELKDILFDFHDPGKIDLEAFMLKNFRFNVSLERFAYLTGRSLSAFKRDFTRIFGATPGRWLLRKRLEEALYLIGEKHLPPSEVYLEVGFEDLSHFSFAFRNAFGVPPSQLAKRRS